MEFMRNVQQSFGNVAFAILQLIYETLLLMLYGFTDCIRGFFNAVHYIICSNDSSLAVQNVSSTVDKRLGSLKSACWNCCVFGSICVISDVLYYHYVLGVMFSKFVQFMGLDLGSAQMIHTFLVYLYFIACTIPMLVLSKVLNFIWYQDTAELAFKKFGLKKNTNIPVSDVYADQIKSYILQLLYCAQAYAVTFLPAYNFIQTMLNIYHLSLLFSLYAFEYKWVHVGMPLHKRLLMISKKWPYYLGFGLPLATFTTIFFSFTNSILVFGIFFPIYVISSSIADVQSHTYNHTINTFKVVDFLSDLIVSFMLKLFIGFRGVRK